MIQIYMTGEDWNKLLKVISQINISVPSPENTNDLWFESVDKILSFVDEKYAYGIKTRVMQAIQEYDFAFVGDVIRKNKFEWLRTRNCGKKTVQALEHALARMGLHLGTDIPHWKVRRETHKRRTD